MNSRLQYINLYSTDPRFNLAAEEYVFDRLPKDRTWFMLWQNDNAIIIGKYQNALAEVNLSAAEERGARIVRRLSGGGAVYHDMGNLNFTFITDAGDIDNLNMKLFCEPIVSVLAELGCHAEISGRNDITIDGMKFSGNSQYIRGGRVMHHGTLMFSSNLETVTEVLNVDPSKFAGKGIKSVRSRVTNISGHISSDISLEQFRELLLERVAIASGGEEYIFSAEDEAAILKISDERYSQWDWNIGASPECSIKKDARIAGVGKLEAYIKADKGIITGIEFRGDFFSREDPAGLAQRFIGCRADSEGYRGALEGVDAGAFFAGLDNSALLRLLTEG